MTYRPVIDQFHLPVPLDPVCVVFFALAFVAAALLCARRASYGLIFLILAQPFDFSRDLLGTTISLPKVVLLGVLAGLATYGGVLRLVRERPAPLLFLAIGAYLAATVLSLAGAAHHGATLRESFKILEYAVLFGAAYLCYRLDPHEAAIATTIAVVTIAVALSALVQEIIGAPSGLYVGAAIVPRIAGVLEGPNQLAGYLEVAIATLGALAIARRRAIVDVALAIATCADVLTFSRAGLLGLLLACAVLVVVARGDALRALRPAFAGFVAGLLGVGGWIAYAHSPDVLRVSFGAPEYAGGVGNRSELYRAALRMFERHPLIGVGAGNYELSLADYGVDGVRTHANSWYLQSLAEGGIVLFLATIGVVAATLATFGRSLRASSPWVLAAFAAALAMSLHQVIDYLVFYPKVGGPLWLLFGIGAAAIAAQRPSKQ
ncbi:MAG TPA: O-antigen ligase family protein [Candidatus Acidoferrales bacterium]|nr:O-antigen ligase family protein [Candidatus Acidoferrales bacterium]